MFTIICIVFAAVLVHGNGLYLACVLDDTHFRYVSSVVNLHALGKPHFKLYFYTPGI
jgi:hypothetical protein